MSYLNDPRHYTRDGFKQLVEGLTWGKGWRPAFPTLHNTGVPSLAQWQGYGATAQERWGGNLNRYYQGLGWHSGPHLVCCPDYIWNLCDLEADGVSVSCWNRLTIGIEMVGNFEAGGDDPTTGEGAKVVDNAIWAIAVLARKLGWSVGNVVTGVGGLHFHRECARDGHPCPGSRVNKADILSRVLAQMQAFGKGGAAPSPAAVDHAPPTDGEARRKWIQSFLGSHGYRNGAGGPLDVDGDLGDESTRAIADFLATHT